MKRFYAVDIWDLGEHTRNIDVLTDRGAAWLTLAVHHNDGFGPSMLLQPVEDLTYAGILPYVYAMMEREVQRMIRWGEAQ